MLLPRVAARNFRLPPRAMHAVSGSALYYITLIEMAA